MPDNPFGDFLGAAANAARQGLSANRALEILRRAGLGIRRDTFLKAYGELRADVQARGNLLGLPLAGKPSADMITRYENARTDAIQHIVAIYSRHKETGEVGIRRVSVRSDALLTRQEAEEYAMAIHAEVGYDEDSVVFGVALEQVRQFSTGEGE